MYKFLITYLPKTLANILIALWYFFLIVVNVYCGISATKVLFSMWVGEGWMHLVINY